MAERPQRVKVLDLLPGDVFATSPIAPEEHAMFIARTQHPIWPHLQLVIWRMTGGRWSHDALDILQDVGEPIGRRGDIGCRAGLFGEGEWATP